MEETKIICPECHSELITEISNFKKCNACGHQFALDKDPVGRRARAEKRGLWTVKQPAPK
jgi:hypothetical protein